MEESNRSDHCARSKRIVPETAKIRANNAVGEKESRLIERCFAECSRYSENRVIFLVSFYERHIDRACGRWQRRIERAIAAPRSRASIVDKLFTKTNRTKNEKEREREREFREILNDSNELAWYLNQSFYGRSGLSGGRIKSEASGDETTRHNEKKETTPELQTRTIL